MLSRGATDMTAAVYVVRGRDFSSLKPGDAFSFDGEEGRHAASVRRTQVGELIDVVDGEGMRLSLEVTGASKSEIVGRVMEVRIDPAHSVHITLIQALAKGGRDEQAIETATEYGVDAVIPWQADRSIARWDGTKVAKGHAKWEACVLAATKQSRRSWLPQVGGLLGSSELAQWIADAHQRGTQVFICHEEAQTHLTAELEQLRDQWSADESGAHAAALIVGPEGGISPSEVEAFEAAGGKAVLLGNHVMRSSSAGPWGIAVIRAFLTQ